MKQKILVTIAIFVSMSYLLLFVAKTDSFAQCSGTVSCGNTVSRVCRNVNTGENCIEGTTGCSCNNSCIGGGSHSCNAYPICQASSICGVYEGVCVRSGSCNYTPPSPVCGNGLCQSGESCSSCPSDCGSCSGSGGGGSGPGGGGGGGSTCSGACFAGISNCGAVGRPNGSGSCGSGELCCDSPVGPPPSRSCQFYRWDTTYQGQPSGQPGVPIALVANNTYRTVGIGMGGSGGLPDDGVCFRSVDPDPGDGFDARFQISSGGDSDRGDGVFGGNYYETRIRSSVPMQSELWIYDNDNGTCSDGPERCEIRIPVFFADPANPPPIMTITSPVDNQIFQRGTTIPIFSDIVDDGNIIHSRMTRLRSGEPQRSRLYVGGVLTDLPFTWYWTNAVLGFWRLRGYAVDNSYNVAWSNQVLIEVSNNAPLTCSPPTPPIAIAPINNSLVGGVGSTDKTFRLDLRTQSDPDIDAQLVDLEVYPVENSSGCTDDDCGCDDGWCGVVASATGVSPNTQVFQNFVIPESVFGDFPQYQWRVRHTSSATCGNLEGEWSEWNYFRIGELVSGTVYEDNGGPYGPVCQAVGSADPFTGGGTVTVSSAGHPNTSASVSTTDGTYSVLVPVSSNITAVFTLPGMPLPTSTPTPTPAPTATPSGPSDPESSVDLKVNGSDGPITVANGANITVSWSSTNATECRASGAWNDTDWVGPRPTSGSHSYTITGSLTYTIRCSRPGELESAEDSVQVNVSGSPPAPPVPSVVLTFNGNPGETVITPGTSGILSWTSSGVSSCTAGSTWGGDSKPTSGSQSIGPVNSTTTYGITCTGPAGNASSSVRLNISGSPSTPTPTPTPASTPVPTPIVTSNQCICPNSSCQHSGLVSPLDDVNFFVRGNIIRDSWWQVVDGPVQAKDAISSQIPVDTCANDPACEPFVVRDSTSSNATGVVVVSNTSASSIDTSDESGYQVNQIAPGTNIAVKGSNIGEVIENYDYFYRNYSMGVSPTSDVNNLNNLTKPGSPPNNGRAYYANGDAEIRNGSWNVSSGESIVVFINGDLNIEREIQVEEGGFLAFIVKGDITIDQSVCQSNYLSQDPVVEGLYLADGTLTIEGTGSGGDCKFVGGGSFVGWSGVNLQRDFNDGGAQSAWNSQAPAELFVYRPDLIVNLPERMSTPLYLWQEVAP